LKTDVVEILTRKEGEILTSELPFFVSTTSIQTIQQYPRIIDFPFDHFGFFQ
jgi:hypothetical protein